MFPAIDGEYQTVFLVHLWAEVSLGNCHGIVGTVWAVRADERDVLIKYLWFVFGFWIDN